MKNFAIVILSLMLGASTLVHVGDSIKRKQLLTDYKHTLEFANELSIKYEAVSRQLRDTNDKLAFCEVAKTDLEKRIANQCKPIFWYRLFDKEN